MAVVRVNKIDPPEESYRRGYGEESNKGFRKAMKPSNSRKPLPPLGLSVRGEGAVKGTQRGGCMERTPGRSCGLCHSDKANQQHTTRQEETGNKHPISFSSHSPNGGLDPPLAKLHQKSETKMATDADGGHQPLRAQSQVDKGGERTQRSQQEMSGLLAAPLPLQKSMLQLRQSKLSWSFFGVKKVLCKQEDAILSM